MLWCCWVMGCGSFKVPMLRLQNWSCAEKAAFQDKVLNGCNLYPSTLWRSIAWNFWRCDVEWKRGKKTPSPPCCDDRGTRDNVTAYIEFPVDNRCRYWRWLGMCRIRGTISEMRRGCGCRKSECGSSKSPNRDSSLGTPCVVVPTSTPSKYDIRNEGDVDDQGVCLRRVETKRERELKPGGWIARRGRFSWVAFRSGCLAEGMDVQFLFEEGQKSQAGGGACRKTAWASSAGSQKKNVFGQEIPALGSNPRAQRLVIFNLKGAKVGVEPFRPYKPSSRG